MIGNDEGFVHLLLKLTSAYYNLSLWEAACVKKSPKPVCKIEMNIGEKDKELWTEKMVKLGEIDYMMQAIHFVQDGDEHGDGSGEEVYFDQFKMLHINAFQLSEKDTRRGLNLSDGNFSWKPPAFIALETFKSKYGESSFKAI